MKILCISDQVDPIIYSTSIKDRFGDVDLVVSAGDLPMEYLGFIVTCLNKPLLFVFGNHNLSELDLLAKAKTDFTSHFARELENPFFETAHGSEYIGFRTKRQSGILFMGLGGCMRYNRGQNQFSEFAMFMKIVSKMPALFFNRIVHGRWLDILVTHAPPEGIHDRPDPCHRGFHCYRWFMKSFKPKVLIHGHIHLYDLNDTRITLFGSTTVVNAFGHHMLQFGGQPDG